MKILFYNHTGQVSGAERMLLMILSELGRNRFDSLVVCPEQGPLQEMAKELGVPLRSIAGLDARFTWRVDNLARYCKSFLGVIRQLRRSVVDIKPDLLHANSIRSGLVATTATVGLGTRVVWHLHDLLPHHPLSTAIRTFASLSKRTRMIAVSEAVGTNFRGRFSRLLKDRVTVILNSIDLDKFQPDATARRRIRKELRFRATDVAIGIVGQVTPRKGQLELLRAFAGTLTKAPNSVLLIVGAPMFNRDHEYLELLKRSTAELGISKKVRILGARSDVGAIMRTLDLLVVNSSAEPFGLVIPEAMACGTPVLATAVDGIPEIITHGENGWLIPAHDEAALTEAILLLQRRPELRERLSERGEQHVAARFSTGRYMTELLTFYRSEINASLTPLPEKSNAMESTKRQIEAA
jgi:glycosyltransferase involved in cell wall biosynthesis